MPALFVSYSGLFGGAEQILLDVATGLDETPTLACPEGALAEAARDAGLHVLALRERRLEAAGAGARGGGARAGCAVAHRRGADRRRGDGRPASRTSRCPGPGRTRGVRRSDRRRARRATASLRPAPLRRPRAPRPR